MQIKSIQKASTWYRTGENYPYSKIEEVWKAVSVGKGQKWEIIVYRCFDHKGNIAAELEADQGLVIIYKT